MANSLGRICVTGATGKAGLAAVLHLREHGHEVVATDIALSGDDVAAGVMAADLTDYGQAVEALSGADAVVTLDANQIAGVIDRISEVDPALSSALAYYADRFSLTTVWEALKQSKNMINPSR